MIEKLKNVAIVIEKISESQQFYRKIQSRQYSDYEKKNNKKKESQYFEKAKAISRYFDRKK